MNVRYFIGVLVFGFLFCFGLYSLVVTASASELEMPEASAAEVSEATSIVQDEQTEAADTEPIAPETAAEAVQDEQSDVEAGQSIAQSEAKAETTQSGSEAGQLIGQIETETGEIEVSRGYEYETLMTLKSIEYQLKIIAGGMVLALISAFIWFTILKPIKGFSRV